VAACNPVASAQKMVEIASTKVFAAQKEYSPSTPGYSAAYAGCSGATNILAVQNANWLSTGERVMLDD